MDKVLSKAIWAMTHVGHMDVCAPNDANSQDEAAFVIAENYTLTFKQLNYSVTTPKWMPAALTEGVPGETKKILHDISGHTSSGRPQDVALRRTHAVLFETMLQSTRQFDTGIRCDENDD